MTDDPLHQPGSPATFWTTINAEENLPGVVDALSGTFWLAPVTLGTLGAFADMGVIAERDVAFSNDPDRRITSLICGRHCVNVDLVRRLSDLMPGTSGDAMERDLFGDAREGIPSHRSLLRYPIVALKAPGAAALVTRRVNRALAEGQTWWRSSVADLSGADAATARALLAQAHARMTAIMRRHTLGTMLTQGVLGQVRALAQRAGAPGLELELSRGLGSLQEVGMLARLWEVSRGGGDLDAFVAAYGFHGPNGSALTSASWREDRGPLEATIAAYRGLGEDRSPLAAADAVAARRRQAVATLLSQLPAARRPPARLLLRYGDALWALRETGKAAYLQAIDVARAASRRIGHDLAAQGGIADADDVAHLTIDELVRPGGGHREDVEFRRARREEYLRREVPQTWTGTPDALPLETTEAAELSGIGASPGLAEGTVRVVSDPGAGTLRDGEVLVCRTTDPSWGTLFLVASAAVIDVGAPSSHGAIVARELGLPCVINTRTGTTALRDGDRVSVDGSTGVVRVLKRA